MGISNVSSGLRSGVCTSTTRPTAPYEGQTIFETDTDRMLVWNGTTWVIPNQTTTNLPALELIKTQTIGTAVSSVEVTDAFSSSYDNYKILISGGVGSQTAELNMRFGSTVSAYHYSFIFTSFNATVAADGSKTGTLFPYVGGMTTNNIQANIEVNSPQLAKPTRIFAGGFGDVTLYAGSVSGILNNTTQYTSFIILPPAGTMTGGTIRVYGYRNS